MALTATQVQQAYLAYFGRPADVLGLNYWEGQTSAAMTAGFTGSPEFAGLYAGLSPAAQVQQVYQNVLGRSAGSAAITYWGGQLMDGVSISTLVNTIYNTVLNESPTSTDYITVQNRVSYATQFTTMMSTSTPDIIGYNGSAAANAARSALFTAVPSSAVATTTFSSLAANVNSVVNVGSAASATTFTLTTGVDTIAPAGNSTINGTLDNNAGAALSTATLGGADTIAATGTGNTLKLTDSSSTGRDTIPTGATITGVQTLTLATAGNAGSSATTTFDVSGLTGLTSVTVTSAGNNGDFITAAATTDITDTSHGTTNAVTTIGGNNVTVTNSGSVTVGSTTATDPAGTVTVNNSASTAYTVVVNGGTAVTVNETGGALIAIDQNVASTGAITVNDTGDIGMGITVGTGSWIGSTITSSSNAGAITINDTSAFTTTGNQVANYIRSYGGSTVTINQNLTVASTLASAIATDPTQGLTTVDGGDVFVEGNASTTSVTVNQSAAVTGVQAVKAVAGVAAVAPVTAVAQAPGVDAVAAVAAVAPVTAVAGVTGVVGVVDGWVSVLDVNYESTSLAGTIKTVTINNFSTASIYDNSLQTLTLSNGHNIRFAQLATNTVATKTLALNLNNVKGAMYGAGSGGALDLTTLNVNTSGADSSLSYIADPALKNLNISGTNKLEVGSLGSTTVGSGVGSAGSTAALAISVSGAAGFNDGGTFANTFAGSTLTTTSSGTITATLHAAGTDTFTGSTGQDIITITADQTKAVTGGSATNNEIVLNNAASTFTGGTTKTVANVTGFTTLGTNTGSSGTFDMSVLKGFNAIDVQNMTATTAETFTNVTAGTSLSIDSIAAAQTAGGIVYQTSDTTGSADTLALTLGTATNKADLTLFSLTLEDANLVGIGTVNLVSNDVGTGTGVNTITTLVDNGLSVLNVSGTGALTIGTLNEATTAATSFTLNNTETNAAATGVTIASFTDASLGTLNFTGTGASFITKLNDNSGVISISNNDAAAAVIGTLTDAGVASGLSLAMGFSGSGATTITTLTNTSTTTTADSFTNSGSAVVTIGAVSNDASVVKETYNNSGTGSMTVSMDHNANVAALDLLGNVAYTNTTTVASSPIGTAMTINPAMNTVAMGVTVAGGTDNAHINLQLAGATGGASTVIDSITLGNGNDLIIDGSLSNTVNVTVGTGSNLIVLGGATTNTTGAFNVTLGAHTLASGPDQINVGTGGTAYATTANYVVTGAVTGDVIHFSADSASSATALTATSTAAATTVASAIGLVETALGAAAHTVAYGVYGGNTYVAETLTGTHAATDTTIVEIVGVHTLTAGLGHVTLAS